MPEKTTEKKAKAALRSGKSPTTAAGEFVREEIEHGREGKHGAEARAKDQRLEARPVPPCKAGGTAQGNLDLSS
jgi:hypothetical protein